MSKPLRLLALAGLAAALLSLAAGLQVWSGWYNVSAVTQHWSPVFKLMEYAMRQSVRHHARAIVPPPEDPAMSVRGAALYSQHCLSCHGAPGLPPSTAGLSMQPVPGPLVDAAYKWEDRELYWIVSNGVKMTGMPAWQSHLSEAQRWDIVAYLRAMPGLTPASQTVSGNDADPTQLAGDIERGRTALTQYACQSCHRIPGVVGADTQVGPALEHMASQHYVSGALPNTAGNLARWIMHPKRYKPGGAMPELGVSAQDAADMAAYLRYADRGEPP